MSQGISATQPMRDVPLSGIEEHGDSTPETLKTGNSKANSLKRFFKLTNKRHSAGEELPTSSSEVMPEDGRRSKDDTDKDASGGSGLEKDDEVEKPKKEHQRRFNLRLGGVTRIVEHANTENFMDSAPSRQSLKNSISSYWHTVFRRVSKKAAKRTAGQNDENDGDVEEEVIERELDEQVQTLSISEDTIEQVIQAIE
ncbi:uncharacterized protein LOC118751242 [Rhagoletis pomonella]|uniref:uncharacterized protein LOC118751242 n=1 Tax=Rhagoletis pomonella TaxID=28610 RepID=UPI00177D04A2|nr:uncharacterized protein LOC118751242 [Rhagoletis pomonella]